ncbi:efflux RND transporter periplasmic adaptor subunit [Desulforamulus hydrothermalis]|uniref:Secretion protein HlyD family protein n=1 Tax=Desulforamulus hydrothermalis Lam5 = DSM 18033 TaxID=1121428 RepID=K8EHU0_9FIRM|nr:efflux RND transporter periplasmic adaptor subunit [Desulforamulus hydrothermalis]CCO08201.1 Secretion protein HlyD family protein [Desulforamulus hydrothermalis Lam5 = DSM 18033]SHH22572.1 RND family efflux transporter, MFP subunit [Desulforamulus hydrothermalis Lam5 = DSM 18033]
MATRNVITALLLSALVFLYGCNQPAGTNRQATGEKAPTQAAVTEKNKPKVITFSGKIEAVQWANLVSKVAGKVAAVYVDMGSFVKKDQLLVSLAAEDKAAEVTEAITQVDSAKVEYELAQNSYRRGKELLAAQAISQADYENLYEGPYKKAEVKLRSAQAVLQKKQIAYDDMFIKAPFAGVITAKNINPGEMAGTQNPVLTLVNLDQVVIRGTVDEHHINKLKVGQQVQVKVAAVSEQPFTGQISNIAMAADSQTKAFPVKIQVANPNHLLKPGMFAEVTIP